MFLPSPGRLDVLKLPLANDDVRIDSGVVEGDVVTPYYDPMLAKLICRGPSREHALLLMVEALEQVDIEGIANNAAFLRRVVTHPQFHSGDVFTGFIDAYKADLVGKVIGAS